MPNLEPTYLRYVYDSLNKGALNAENAAALPRGFVGLYEQEFSHNTPAGVRKKVLNQLTLWALFKGPVSANMAAAVLELEEDQMKDLVDTYSSWFNSPESGKYQLYHERLRVYLFQKLKAEEVQVLNEKLISFLEDAIRKVEGEEDEYYALEHLHQHMALESQLGNHYERLHNYVNQESLWRRQIQLSKGYAWSQNAVQQGIKEGARRNHEMNTIRSTVNSVKLMTQEQNSAEDILNLLNEGDFQSALKRAESWEGERQFKLYLLFIHELTIGTSKEANFRKEACKAVLEAIDQTPEDHSVLDWCMFYPELAIYKYHEELLKMELDGMVIWKRGNYIYDIENLIKLKDVNIDFIMILANKINDEHWKSSVFAKISKKLLDQERREEAMLIALEITKEPMKCVVYADISSKLFEKGEKEEAKIALQLSLNAVTELTKKNETRDLVTNDVCYCYIKILSALLSQGQNDESKVAIKKSLHLISEITDAEDKCRFYLEISKILMEQGKKKESQEAIKESLKVASEIANANYKSKSYAKISKLLMEQREKEESLRVASNFVSDYDKPGIFAEISNILIKQGQKEESKLVMKESLRIASSLINIEAKSKAYTEIFEILIKQGNVKESLKVAYEIFDAVDKAKAYLEISKELMEQGKVKDSQESMKETLKVASEIINANDESKAYLEISKVLMEHGRIKESQEAMKETLKAASEITNSYNKSRAFQKISKILMEKGENVEFREAIKESIKVDEKYNLSNDSIRLKEYFPSLFVPKKSFLYIEISNALMVNGKIDEALQILFEIAKRTNNYLIKLIAFKIIVKQGKKEASKLALQESLRIASEITDELDKSKVYAELSKILQEQGESEDSKLAMQESFRIASNLIYEWQRDSAYVNISLILMLNGEREKSLKVASEIKDTEFKSDAYLEIFKILIKQEKKEKFHQILSKVTNKRIKSIGYRLSSKYFWKKGEKEESNLAMQESKKLASEITVELEKSKENAQIGVYEYSEIYTVLMEQGKKEESKLAMQESLRLASKITDIDEKSWAFQAISMVLMKQRNKEEAIQIADNINQGSEKLKAFIDFGKIPTFKEAQNCLPMISLENNQGAFIKGMSEKIYEQMDLSEAIYPYLYHHSKYTENLSNILFHQAKMACFFEKKRNEEKLDMLSEVLDIKDWRRISASA